jgi:hypothetical protein
MEGPSGYIELNRRFSKLDASATPEAAELNGYLADSHGRRLVVDWEQLLNERIVVILGEPGSGKSWELRSRWDGLRRRNNFAFLIELERVVSGSVGESIGPLAVR